MAFGRQTTERLVRKLNGATTRRATLGTTVEAGELVTLQSDGYWDPTNASTAQLTVAIALQDGLVGDEIDIVTAGPVNCLEDATPGSLIYASDTPGEPSESVGTKDLKVGYAESATVLYVQPQIIDWS